MNRQHSLGVLELDSLNATTLLNEFDKQIQDLSNCDVVVHVYTFDLSHVPDGLGVGLRANFGDFIGFVPATSWEIRLV